MAAQVHGVGAELVGAAPPPSVGLAVQATAAAVGAANAALSDAMAVLAGRVQMTGAKLTAAGVGFVAQDGAGAHRIAASVGDVVDV